MTVNNPFSFTHCADPAATHAIRGHHPTEGSGILSYHTDEFSAHRRARNLRDTGGVDIEVFAYRVFGVNDTPAMVSSNMEAW